MKADEQRLRVFEMACLRKILGVTRRDRLRNTRVRELLHYCKDLPTSIRKTKLKYVGHVNRMGNGRYPKILLEGHIAGTDPEEDQGNDGWKTSSTSVKRLIYHLWQQQDT